jgi:hypothetical protein
LAQFRQKSAAEWAQESPLNKPLDKGKVFVSQQLASAPACAANAPHTHVAADGGQLMEEEPRGVVSIKVQLFKFSELTNVEQYII